MTIESIQVRSSLRGEIMLRGQDGSPIVIDYEAIPNANPNSQATRHDRNQAAYQFEKLLDLDFKSGERLYLNFTVAIATNEIVDRNTFSIEFYPYLDKGFGIDTLADL